MSEEATAAVDQPNRSIFEVVVGFFKTCDRTWLAISAVALVALFLAFWPLLRDLPAMWLGVGTYQYRTGDGYYSHGLLVPIISGYIIAKKWPRIKDIAIRPGWFALVPILLTLWVLWAANAVDIQQIRSIAFIVVLLSVVWLVAGIRWMVALSPSILYLLFALPVWTGVIDNYTNPLQRLSTTVAFFILKGVGYTVYAVGQTSLYLDHFDLNVAVPCSGLKLLVAVTAFTVFFMLIARLRWWANGLMVVLVLPLCLFINGLRIALIGIAGEEYGRSAGLSFHDYSGYITLIVCFFLLFKFARLLGWKD
ncbi:MAG TPA: exosortase/archaeosortase family protein [Fimbriimonadaceae bacterium]|nr:exosortase/archaeosortase family protein [Fimbriimonadaceae bacterium]